MTRPPDDLAAVEHLAGPDPTIEGEVERLVVEQRARLQGAAWNGDEPWTEVTAAQALYLDALDVLARHGLGEGARVLACAVQVIAGLKARRVNGRS